MTLCVHNSLSKIAIDATACSMDPTFACKAEDGIPTCTFPDLFCEIITFVFPLLTCGPFLSIPHFHHTGFPVLVYRTRLSAYSSSQSSPDQKSKESTSNTMMNSSRFKTEPWCTPTLIINASPVVPLIFTALLAFSYIEITTHTYDPFLYSNLSQCLFHDL